MQDIDSLIIVNRTTPHIFQVTSESGEPLQGASVTVLQKSHSFSFGSCVTGGFGNLGDPFQQQYEDTLLKYFNAAVDEWTFKWPSVEPSQDNLNFGQADNIRNWCLEHDLPLRGHTVFWANEVKVPDWARNLDNDNLLDEMHEHVIDIVDRYPEMMEFDLNNEMILNNYFRGRFGESIIDSMFTWSLDIKPEAVLYLNEYGIINDVLLDLYIDQIQSLLDQGIQVGGIGIQGHVFTSDEPTDLGTFAGDTVFSADYLWNIIDTLAQFSLPIKITEFDFNAPNDSIHAEWIQTFYKTMYAHPMMEGVIMWGFWEAIHWRPEGAIFNEDFSAKPSALAYYNLIYNELWNNDTLFTNGLGTAEINLFHGNHEISVEYGGVSYETTIESIQIPENNDPIILNIELAVNPDYCMQGDVNCDDHVNIVDIVTIIQFILEQTEPDGQQFGNSDLNSDGEINISDIILLVQMILQ